MRRTILTLVGIAAALAVVILPAHPKDAVVESQWTARPVVIDGGDKDWGDATPITDKNSKVQYALKNDGEHLYIIMVFRDEMARSTLAMTGMRIFATAGPKKSKDEGFLFLQKQMTPDELIASLEAKGEVLSEDRKAELKKQAQYVVYLEEPIVAKKGAEAAGEKPEPGKFHAVQQGPIAVYEFRIPLGRIGGIGSVGPGSEIKLGFEWGGVTKEIMKSIMADRAGSGSRARASAGSSDSGFRDSGGEGGGEGPDFSYSRDPRYKKHSFWIDAKLANQ